MPVNVTLNIWLCPFSVFMDVRRLNECRSRPSAGQNVTGGAMIMP